MRLGVGLPDAHCEPIHLDQVLANLMANALEHTQATAVQITATSAEGVLEVAVADNGSGIPAERIGHLFARHAIAAHHRASGLGLGLYLCHLIVEHSFGERIWLERTGPSGTTFRFTVPAAPARTSGRD